MRILQRINEVEVSKSVEAYLYLGRKGILSNIGQNKDGLYYFIIYGYAYEKD